MEKGVVSAIVKARCVVEGVIDPSHSSDCMFGARIASAFPPIAARPDVVDAQRRVSWGGRAGREAREGGEVTD